MSIEAEIVWLKFVMQMLREDMAITAALATA
jgi:hypothetical protein